MLTNSERSQVKVILQSPQWQVIERAMEMYIKNIKEQSCLRDDLWQTARQVAMNEGQVVGLRTFVQELYKEANVN